MARNSSLQKIKTSLVFGQISAVMDPNDQFPKGPSNPGRALASSVPPMNPITRLENKINQNAFQHNVQINQLREEFGEIVRAVLSEVHQLRDRPQPTKQEIPDRARIDAPGSHAISWPAELNAPGAERDGKAVVQQATPSADARGQILQLNKTIKNQRASLSGLNKKMEGQENTIRSQGSRLENQKRNLSSVQAKADMLTAELDQVTSAYRAARDDNAELTAKIQSQRASIVKLQQQVADLHKDLSARTSSNNFSPAVPAFPGLSTVKPSANKPPTVNVFEWGDKLHKTNTELNIKTNENTTLKKLATQRLEEIKALQKQLAGKTSAMSITLSPNPASAGVVEKAELRNEPDRTITASTSPSDYVSDHDKFMIRSFEEYYDLRRMRAELEAQKKAKAPSTVAPTLTDTAMQAQGDEKTPKAAAVASPAPISNGNAEGADAASSQAVAAQEAADVLLSELNAELSRKRKASDERPSSGAEAHAADCSKRLKPELKD